MLKSQYWEGISSSIRLIICFSGPILAMKRKLNRRQSLLKERCLSTAAVRGILSAKVASRASS